MSSKRKDVVQSGVIGHKDLRAAAIDVIQAFNFYAGTTEPEIILRPPAHAVVLEPAAARYKAAQNGNGSPKKRTETASGPAPYSK